MSDIKKKGKTLPCADYMSIVDNTIELRNPNGCTPEKYEDELNFVITLLESRGYTIEE